MKRWIDGDITHIGDICDINGFIKLQYLKEKLQQQTLFMNISLYSIVYQLDGEIVLNRLWIPIGKKIIFCLHGITTTIFAVIWKNITCKYIYSL